jgi:2-phosphosulfolactate phosphatase
MLQILTTECSEHTEPIESFTADRMMAEQRLNIFKLPRDVDESALAGSAVVVIDVLRATSTICQALAAGAREVVPFVEIDQALAAAEKAGRSKVVLGGERKGLRIEGFDLGNSPAEYTAAAIQGRPVFMTTTNGTRAMQHARRAATVIAGSFLNLSAVVAALQHEPRIDILCAGTDGSETSEDMLLAGAIVDKLTANNSNAFALNETAELARREWQTVVSAAEQPSQNLHEHLAHHLNASLGGRNCTEAGNGADNRHCAQVDLLHIVPRLDTREWKITAN